MKEARDAREGAMEGRWGCAPHWRDRLLTPDVLGGAASRLIIRLAARGTTARRLNACAPRREPTAPNQLCGRIFPGARAGALDESQRRPRGRSPPSYWRVPATRKGWNQVNPPGGVRGLSARRSHNSRYGECGWPLGRSKDADNPERRKLHGPLLHNQGSLQTRTGR